MTAGQFCSEIEKADPNIRFHDFATPGVVKSVIGFKRYMILQKYVQREPVGYELSWPVGFNDESDLTAEFLASTLQQFREFEREMSF